MTIYKHMNVVGSVIRSITWWTDCWKNIWFLSNKYWSKFYSVFMTQQNGQPKVT